MDPSHDLVLELTVAARPPLVPELCLRLATEGCPLWRAGEAELKRVGLTDPYWAFAWPGGQALARHVLDHHALVRGQGVLDFGCGGAIAGLAALKAGAASVLAADVDPVALEAAQVNAALNATLLFTTSRDLVGVDEGWDVVLAGDVLFEAAPAARTLAWLRSLAARGALVLVGDPHRGFFDAAGAELLAEYDAPSDVDVDGRFPRATGVWRLRA